MSRLHTIPACLAAVHLIGSVLFAGWVSHQWTTAQWQLYWTLTYPVDWPMSYVTRLAVQHSPDVSLGWLPYPIGKVRMFVVPCLCHCVLGSLWYFVWPATLIKIYRVGKVYLWPASHPV